MCLNIKGSPKVASQDILCYKFFISRDKKLISPYTHKEVEQVETLITPQPTPNMWLHSFAGTHGILRSLFIWTPFLFNRIPNASKIDSFVCYKYIIPSGTEYVEGTDTGTDCYAYASQQLVLVEEVFKLEKPTWTDYHKIIKML
jgi:hypothetical protein